MYFQTPLSYFLSSSVEGDFLKYWFSFRCSPHIARRSLVPRPLMAGWAWLERGLMSSSGYHDVNVENPGFHRVARRNLQQT